MDRVIVSIQMYTEKNIKLIYNDFMDFEYKQHRTEEFVKGLSIIDAIFNIGFENIKLKFKEISNDSSKLSL